MACFCSGFCTRGIEVRKPCSSELSVCFTDRYHTRPGDSPLSRGRILTRRTMSAALLLALASPSALVGAQGTGPTLGVSVFGNVLDMASGEPISAAMVRFDRSGLEGEPIWSGQTDGTGRFRTNGLPLGEYEVTIEALSFRTFSDLVELEEEGAVDLRVDMVGVDFQLNPVIATGRRESRLERSGFYERRQFGGTGFFMDREEIEEIDPFRLADVFRGIPGATVISGIGLQGDGIRLRGNCRPVVVLNGVTLAYGADVIDEVISAGEVEGIEVYHGTSAPIQYVGMTTCGVVMLWSRDPVSRGRPFSWGRLLFSIGFGVLFVFGPTAR